MHQLLMKTLLSFACLFLSLVSSDPGQTTVNFDQTTNNSYSWVEKTAEVTYTYSLVPDWLWHQLPDMAITIEIPFDQRVLIEYNIQMWTEGNGRLYTKVLVDGVEPTHFFRTATGYHGHHNNWMSKQIWLHKGKHTVQVIYQLTLFNMVGHGFGDWNVMMMNVGYYQP
jgi:hypothetical protein